jgi:S-adenosylmethionine hydrolase
MTNITLLTDFGIKDGNVGVMKGVIWSITPSAKIADLSHNIQPQNLEEAALVLKRAVPYFSAGTVHTVVVDPGVGTDRRPMAARLGSQYFVGPDNGVISMWLEDARNQDIPIQFFHLDKPQYWLAEISHVFHGRDIFAPSAAHLAGGVPIEKTGTSFDNPVLLDLSHPVWSGNQIYGQVIHIDHFGNISTNIRMEHLKEFRGATVSLCGVNINGMVNTFGEKPVGSIVALIGSTGNLIVSVVNGSAAKLLKAEPGDPVTITQKDAENAS